LRHCIWTCKMTRIGGKDCASTIALNHEVGGLDRGGSLDEFDMDSRNNDTGIAQGSDQYEKTRRTCVWL
jgi:hypothetical protein